MYTKKCAKFCEVCAHFSLASWYYINRKNPPIHYIVFATHPIRRNTFSKKASLSRWLFYCLKISLLFTLFSAMKYLLRRNPAVRNTVTE